MAQSRKLSKRVSRKSVSRKRSILKRISKSLKKLMNKVKRSVSRKSKRVTRKRASPKRSSPKPKNQASHKIGSRSQVFHGSAHKTAGGLTKSDLMMNKHGRIVSRKAHKAGKKALMHLHAAGYVAKPGKFALFRKH